MHLQDVLYYVFWAGAFFVMMRFGCGAHIMGHGQHHHTSDPDHDTTTSTQSLPPGQAIDPVCGMSVETSSAKTSVYQDGIYFFCSQKCREKFEGAPESYAKTASAGSHEKEHHHGFC